MSDLQKDGIIVKVLGEPVPQGSVRAFVTKSGRPIITHSNRNTKEWRQRIATEAQKKRPNSWEMSEAVILNIDFLMTKPKSMSKKVVEDVKRPDLDKLIRAVLDGLTGIFYNDDSQVVQIMSGKRYANEKEASGVTIEIYIAPVKGEHSEVRSCGMEELD